MSSSMSTSVASGEIVYGTDSGSTAGNPEETRVMSERVQQLAGSIYKEFERMIQRYDEGSVKELMPLVVNVLESLDLAYLEKEEHEVEVELLKEDNEQLVTQYEREKQLRRAAEQRLLEFEDHFDEERTEYRDKIQSLESITRMLELKGKNSADHANRMEERETEMKHEYAKLHERYTELFKTHMDYMERTKFLMGNDKFDMLGSMTASMMTPRQGSEVLPVPGAKHVADITSLPSHPVGGGSIGHAISSDLQEWSDAEMSAPPEPISSARSSEDRRYSSRQLSMPSQTPQSEFSADDTLGADLTGGLVDPAEFASAGMGKEVENLIKENTELMETKNALNIVKNDLIAKVDELTSEQEILREEIRSLEMVRAKMNERIKELEQELKDAKHDLDELRTNKDEEDIPMAQRKRFTRVEMARVLMERNQYKEKLMELQETIRWTEMIRASRNDPSLKRKRGSIWEFFSGLFSGPTSSPSQQQLAAVNIRYNAPTKQLMPGTDPLLRKKAEKPKAFDFLDSEYSSEKRAAERKEQYKLVKAHVKKDESGRLQAYGWSIPAVNTDQATVPVPIYCRPLMDQEPNLRIWCATGILLNGGRTKDGGYIVGGSVFYSKPPVESTPTPPSDQAVARLDHELACKVKEMKEFWESEWEYSSLVWICSSTHGQSQLSVIDANNPADVLDSFDVCSSHLLCISAIPGARETDLTTDSDYNTLCRLGNYKNEEVEMDAAVGEVRWVTLTAQDDGLTYLSPSQQSSPKKSALAEETGSAIGVTSSEKAEEIIDQSLRADSPSKVKPVSAATDGVDLAALTEEYKSRILQQLPEHIKDGLSRYQGVGELTTALPTVWMGAQNGYLYIHSSVSEWRRCLRRIKMEDSILALVHYKGRIFAAVANGTIAVFHRNADGQWSTDGYHVLTIGKPQHSVRCITVVADRIWVGYRNLVFVIDPCTLNIENAFSAHPRKESQVRQLVWVGDGVWCSIRLDSTMRLYHAHTCSHLQDVDIEPYVSKMLGTSKLGFSFVRITSLLVSSKRLWIGTGNGVVISVPLGESGQHQMISSKSTLAMSSEQTVKAPGGVVRVYSVPSGISDHISLGTFIPYCNMAQAQLSFHGHKDAVKFFVAVPGSGRKLSVVTEPAPADPAALAGIARTEESERRRMMVVSGGDGYIDFRVGDEDEDEEGRQSAISKKDLSHLIVWEVQTDV